MEKVLNFRTLFFFCSQINVVFVWFVAVCASKQQGHVGTVSSPNHTFFLGKLEQAVNQYSVHILLLITDNNLLE